MSRLSSVPARSEPKTPPRGYENIVRAIYEDPRAGHEARELLLAVAYAVDLVPRDGGVSPLIAARRVLGRDSIGRPRYDALMAADAPRYEPPQELNRHTSQMSCGAPRLRPYQQRPYTPRNQPEQPELPKPTPIRPDQIPPAIAAMAAALKEQAMATYTPPRDWRTEDGVCGANAHRVIEEKDPRTGWITGHPFCKRHQDHAARVAGQVRAQNEAAPEPIPNAGGLLPCYFKADWEKVYRHYKGPYWEPPVYGLCADDWPAPGEVFRSHRRLRVLDGPVLVDGEAS
ncbi:MAG: sle1 [Actinomycetia bacterium]|nr:sle1 [Actinomycetes bacterium]